jgi:hypothetical protein
MSATIQPTAAKDEFKEVMMDVAIQEGGSSTRRRKAGGGGRRRRTARAAGEENTQQGGALTVVEKAGIATTTQAPVTAAAAPMPAPTPSLALAPIPGAQAGGAAKKSAAAPVVILAPAKKKQAKVMLVPKSKVAGPHARLAKKTFKAKRIRVMIDNTAKTVKHRRQVLQRVDEMNDEQLRAAAVGAKLARREKVASVPLPLLRQMVKDYQTMRGMLL